MTAARHELHGDFRPTEAPIGFRPQAPPARPQPRFADSLDLVALPSAVTVAQLFVARTLRRWGAMFMEPQVLRVAAELVALAVEETGPGGGDPAGNELLNPIEVCLAGHDRHVLFEVVHVQIPGAPSEVHRDLAVVNALALAWGAYSTSSERIVWAELDLMRPRKVSRRELSFLRPC